MKSCNRSERAILVHIHSDDMGATKAVTERMLQSWLAGSIDGFSVIANGLGSEALTAGLRAAPERPARIGVHLNLSEGPSCALAGEVSLLVDDHGVLKHTFTTLLRAWLKSSAEGKRRLREQAAIEWRAQISKAQRLVFPRPVNVVDSHMHVHMLPFLFDIAAVLTKDAGIPSIRIPREPFYSVRGARDWLDPDYCVNVLKHVVLRVCARSAEGVARRNGLGWADRFIGVLYTGAMTTDRALAGIGAAQRQRAACVEVLFHVGRAEDAERDRWIGRRFLADFYCSPSRDMEREEAAELRQKLVQSDRQAIQSLVKNAEPTEGCG